jgi:hypothetical protein
MRRLILAIVVVLMPAIAVAQPPVWPSGSPVSLASQTYVIPGPFINGAGVANGTITVPSTACHGWVSDTAFCLDAANAVALRNGTNAQRFRVYNTFTDASNFESGFVDWTTNGSVFTVGTTQAGTGSARQTQVQGTRVNFKSTTFGSVTFNLDTDGTFRGVSATAGFGYGTGAGGTVTQATSKATAVTLSTVTGQITLNAAALAANTAVSFTLTNTAVAAPDLVVVNHVSAGTAGAYTFTTTPAAGSVVITVRNVTAGSLSEAIVLQFAVIKAATS